MTAEPRPRADRRRDTEHRLTNDVDVWVASASADGKPYLVPLSFDWDGAAVLVATPTNSPTGKNLARSGVARLALGPTRDVTMIEADVEVIEIDAAATGAGRPVRRAQRLRPTRADLVVPLVPPHSTPHPGVARGGRAARTRADARRSLAGLTG